MAENGDAVVATVAERPEDADPESLENEQLEYAYEEPDEEGGEASLEASAAGEDVCDLTDPGGDAEVCDLTEDDPELEAIKARVREMEEEAQKLKEMQSEVERQMNISGGSNISAGSESGLLSTEDKVDADNRSVYVGNVDYYATAEELEAHFHGCGAINRVTILCDKFTGHPKGFAYVEFVDTLSVDAATALSDSLFRGRQIKVNPKRTNRPGISCTDRGRPRRRPRANFYYGYQPRGGRRGFRPRRYNNFFSPY